MGVLEQAQQLGNYIVGHRTHSTSAEYADVTNPATGESLGKAFLNGKEDVAAKVLLCQ